MSNLNYRMRNNLKVKFWHGKSQRYVNGWLGGDHRGECKSIVIGDDGVNYFCIDWGLIVPLEDIARTREAYALTPPTAH